MTDSLTLLTSPLAPSAVMKLIDFLRQRSELFFAGTIPSPSKEIVCCHNQGHYLTHRFFIQQKDISQITICHSKLKDELLDVGTGKDFCKTYLNGQAEPEIALAAYGMFIDEEANDDITTIRSVPHYRRLKNIPWLQEKQDYTKDSCTKFAIFELANLLICDEESLLQVFADSLDDKIHWDPKELKAEGIAHLKKIFFSELTGNDSSTIDALWAKAEQIAMAFNTINEQRDLLAEKLKQKDGSMIDPYTKKLHPEPTFYSNENFLLLSFALLEEACKNPACPPEVLSIIRNCTNDDADFGTVSIPQKRLSRKLLNLYRRGNTIDLPSEELNFFASLEEKRPDAIEKPEPDFISDKQKVLLFAKHEKVKRTPKAEGQQRKKRRVDVA